MKIPSRSVQAVCWTVGPSLLLMPQARPGISLLAHAAARGEVTHWQAEALPLTRSLIRDPSLPACGAVRAIGS